MSASTPSFRARGVLVFCCFIVFAVGFSLRWEYQRHSEEVLELRGDSVKYMTAAFNYWKHGALSLDPPRTTPPKTRTDLSPGYPLFLSIFFEDPPDSRSIKKRAQTAQVVLGAASCVATFLLAFTCLPLGWSLLAGILLAVSPHHIALVELTLTETLYTCMLVFGLLMSMGGWLQDRVWLFCLGILLLGFSGHVRFIGFVVPIALILAMLLERARNGPSGRLGPFRLFSAAAFAALIIFSAYQVFIAPALKVPGGGDVVKREYTSIGSPLGYLKASVKPPRFFVAGVSHVIVENLDPDLRLATESSFVDIPTDYLLWNCCARWMYSWHFDNVYNGGAEIYPMRVSTFDGDGLPAKLQELMRWLHWPLFLLAIGGAILCISASLRGLRENAVSRAMPLGAVFVLFLLALNIVHWLPRYTLPMYPVAYVLVALALRWAWERMPGKNAKPASHTLR